MIRKTKNSPLIKKIPWNLYISKFELVLGSIFDKKKCNTFAWLILIVGDAYRMHGHGITFYYKGDVLGLCLWH